MDLDKEAAFAHALAGNNLYVEAHAGTGKTHFLQKCAAALRERGKIVQRCALTHVAMANLR
ncbi:MAG: AAA family ATPase, partial [Candidatus Fonsibacter sp.]